MWSAEELCIQVSNTEVGSVEKTVCKVRGITLNYRASQLVNFKVIRDMILSKDEPNINVHTDRTIKRKRNESAGMVSIVTEPEYKLYRISFSRGDDYTIRPSLAGRNRCVFSMRVQCYSLHIHV